MAWIGAVYAARLARRGYDLLLVDPNKERPDDLAKQLAADSRRNLWNAAGTPVKHLPLRIVTLLTEMVDTALASLDEGELVTIVSPPDAREWQTQEETCRALLPDLSCGKPAAKYATSGLEG